MADGSPLRVGHFLFIAMFTLKEVDTSEQLQAYASRDGAIQVRKVDTYMFLYAIAACAVAYFAGKESAEEKAKERERQEALQAEYAKKTDKNATNKK